MFFQKSFLLFLYFAYVIKKHDKQRAAFELQEHYTDEVKDSIGGTKIFYDKNDFHWKVIADHV